MPTRHRFPRTIAIALALASGLPLASPLDGQVIGSADTEEEIERIRLGQDSVIFLNPRDPTFNVWQQLRDFSEDNRPPGPINVQRFEGHVPWVGIPTFFHLPVALTPEDLGVGNVEVAILGAELIGDMRARSWGPTEMRNPHRSEVYHNWGAFAMPELDAGRTWLHELTVVDYGDAPTHPMSIERSIPVVQDFVREVASVEIEGGKRTIPVIIGGGHALMYPDGMAMAEVYGAGNVAIVHFDAHADQAPVAFGHIISHGNPVRRLVESGMYRGDNIIQVGLRGPNSTDMDGVDWNRENGLRYHMMTEIDVKGWPQVVEEVLAEAKAAAPNLFISFDVDVVDPAFIPGTSTPEPGGLTMREALPMMRRLCAEANVVGIEIVELRPDSDPGYTTLLNAKAILRQCLNGLAMRKAGLTDPGYLDPRITDDGVGPARNPGQGGGR